jgi:5'-nucleotidase / UDP-sugar diphosphatase
MLISRYCLIILLQLLILSEAYSQRRITILHTNDLHSRLLEEYTGDSVHGIAGGFARIATLINQEKTNNPEPVITLDAGDFLMGTFFQALEPGTGFQLHLMKEMGYDAICLGNHEFDFGIKTLSEYVIKANEMGAPPLLSSNLEYADIAEHKDFADLFEKEYVKPYHIIETDGIRVGVFGLLGREAYMTAPNAQTFNLKSRVMTARQIVSKLRDEEKVDVVICLSHSGLYKNESGEWKVKEDIKLATYVEGIDVIISGHTHTKLEKPVEINGTYIIQANEYGRYLGKLTFDIDSRSLVDYQLISVNDDIAEDENIRAMIQDQLMNVKEFVKNETNLDYDSSYFETQYLMKPDEGMPQEANIGDFVADAMRYYVNKYDSIGTNMTLIAQGFIRQELQPGIHNLGGIFEVTSLGKGNDQVPGYPLSRLYFTAQELKRMLEFILIAAERNPSYHCFFSGIKLVIDENAVFMQKIKEIYISDKDNHYQLLDFSKDNKQLYASTTDAFMMEFFTHIKKVSYGLVRLSPKTASGEIAENIDAALIDIDPFQPGIQEAKIWKSVIEYGQSFSDINNNGIPDIPDLYR